MNRGSDINPDTDSTEGPELQSRRLAILKMGSIGEAVALLPALANLTRVVPEDHITLLSESTVHRIVRRDHPEIHHLPADGVYSSMGMGDVLVPAFWRDLSGLLKACFGRHFDDFLCFQTSEYWTNRLKPHFFARLLRYRRSVGFSGPGLPAWDRSVPARQDRWDHMFRKNLRLVTRYGAPRTVTEPTIGVDERRRRDVVKRLRSASEMDWERPCLMVCPGAADRRRCWPLERYETVLGTMVDRHGVNVVLIGSREESDITGRLADALPAEHALDTAGMFSLEALPELIDRADLFLANDTGPLHVAVARTVPSVGLFGPGILQAWASYDLPHVRALYYEDEEDPHLIGYRNDPSILRKITAADVLSTLEDLHGRFVA